jgi:DNA-binding response OmpR family regulator
VRVLVIDDFPSTAEVSSILFELMGHPCRHATTGREGLEQAAAFDPELVIVDLGLPDLTGYEVARELRARAPDGPLHIAALTGWSQRDDRAKAVAAGIDQYVVKPATADKLHEILRTAARHLYGAVLRPR